MLLAMMDVKSWLGLLTEVNLGGRFKSLGSEVDVLDTDTGIVSRYPTSYARGYLDNVGIDTFGRLVCCGVHSFFCRGLDFAYMFKYRILYWKGYVFELPGETGVLCTFQMDGGCLYVYTGDILIVRGNKCVRRGIGIDEVYYGEEVTMTSLQQRILMDF